jgi:hypothetical protein
MLRVRCIRWFLWLLGEGKKTCRESTFRVGYLGGHPGGVLFLVLLTLRMFLRPPAECQGWMAFCDHCSGLADSLA